MVSSVSVKQLVYKMVLPGSHHPLQPKNGSSNGRVYACPSTCTGDKRKIILSKSQVNGCNTKNNGEPCNLLQEYASSDLGFLIEVLKYERI